MDIPHLNKLRKQLQQTARKAEDLEGFVSRALQQVGELVNVRFITLFIRDVSADRCAIHATLTRKKNEWRLTVLDTDLSQHPFSSKQTIPAFFLHSSFSFHLDLSPRWTGMVVIGYPGIKIISPEQYQILSDILEELSDSLYIVLINQKLQKLEGRLRKKENANQEQRQIITDLSKEIYCVSSVFMILTQTHDVVEIFTRILDTTLPLLKAKFGGIYFPETDQCIYFQSTGLTYHRSINYHCTDCRTSRKPCLKTYYESRNAFIKTYNDGISIRPLQFHSASFSPSLKAYFSSLGIRSVFEFSLTTSNDFFGFGLVGFSDNNAHTDQSRLLKITLHMTNLLLKNISLMRDLERQVRLKSQRVLEIEKQQKFMFDQVRPVSTPGMAPRDPVNHILEEIDRSRRKVLMGELASGVAHQIRNPLNNLLGALHLIKNKNIEEEERGQLFDQLTERMETMHRMISKFIHYTRIPELNLSSEIINDTLNNSIQTFKGWFDLAEVAVITSFDPRVTVTKLDLYLMNQVFHNIIKNAMEAMYSHGRFRVSTRKLEIKHGPKPRLEFVEILFQDSGPGIPEEYIDKVLNPFFSRKEDGLGVGLAIVDHVVRLHGGAIRIENRPVRGINLTICLPVR